MEYIIAGSIALVVILAVILIVRTKTKKSDRQGRAGERKVARVLKHYAAWHGCKVLNGVYLPLYDATTEVDHILIGRFGLLVIETKSIAGEVFGDERQTNWTHMVGTKKHSLYSPLLQNKTHVDNIRHLFNQEHIYKVNIESLVVFTNAKTILNLPKGLPVIKLKKLKGLLESSRFAVDNGVDVDKVYNAITQHVVSGRKVEKDHKSFVVKLGAKNSDK